MAASSEPLDTTAVPPARAVTPTVHRNVVELVGRLSGEPQERELPSGDRLVSFRLVVEREQRSGAAGKSRARVDTLDCIAWGARVRRSALGWPDGCTLEVEGAVRRRFRRTPNGPISRVEVEVVRARVRR
jgi:single-strand DNA-binding protein